jgi:hypothetical protein
MQNPLAHFTNSLFTASVSSHMMYTTVPQPCERFEYFGDQPRQDILETIASIFIRGQYGVTDFVLLRGLRGIGSVFPVNWSDFSDILQ